MTTLVIQMERNEMRALKASAARQLRTPENLARFLILKQMGFIYEPSPDPENANTGAFDRQAESTGVAAA